MKRLVATGLAATLFFVGAVETRGQCVWGSFDASRVNYAGGELVTGNHSTLRSIVTQAGGVLAPSTPTLTSSYLAGVDVFYTSLLSNSTGALSPAEQTALIGWVQGGGTLIVTGDIFPLAAYDSFTAPFGVTNYASISTSATGAPVPPVHPLTDSIAAYRYVTNCTFTYGADAQLLGNDSAGNAFLIVLEPSTGYFGGGRIVVFGDHNMFTDSYIASNDNVALAGNLVDWACDAGSPLCPSNFPTWANYGAGWPGTSGVPSLVPTGNPTVGQPLGLQIGNSLGAPTTGYLLLGAASAAQPTALGGTLLVQVVPSLAFSLPLAAPGILLAGNVPSDPTLCGVSLYVQVLQVDPAASHGASFSRGLSLTFG
ncbi:MAG: DUF4350 domain-containing protein [Planctomycetota bacterium JB042]